jgi:hypothetical protein
MTQMESKEPSPFDGLVKTVRGLRELLWFVALTAAAFGTFVLWVVHPMRSDLELVKRRTANSARVTELVATLLVEPDSTARRDALRELRALRRFSQDEHLLFP